MKIRQLLSREAILYCGLDLSLNVGSLAYDSRKVQEGALFFALQGAVHDGNKFVSEALEHGAAGIVSDKPPPSNFSNAWIQVKNARQSLSSAACCFYKNPQRKIQLIGVTGTNGKTTTCHLISSILRKAGRVTGFLGTIGYQLVNKRLPSTHTTPGSLDLSIFLSALLEEGGDVAVVEVSSHALAQDRVYGYPFSVAVFTNLSSDHLDYHGTIEKYFSTKQKLFEDNGAGIPRLGIFNLDDAYGKKLADSFERPKVTYGRDRCADIRLMSKRSTFSGLDVTLNTPSGTITLHSSLIGEHNLLNIMAAVATAIGMEVNVDSIVKGISQASFVPGRFERIEVGQPFELVVDYAHTEDALRNLILSARKLNAQRIITLFGCGGCRDRSKRPLMGETAGRLSDFAILTSDNPRTENPIDIMNDALVGLQKSGGKHCIEGDRKKAIRLALEEARPGDVVLITGRGHETHQILDDQVIEFDDREVCRDILADFHYLR